MTDSGSLDSVGLIWRAVNQNHAVIAAIPSSVASAPTPCSDWNVSELVEHIVGQTMPNFVVAARGETPDWQAPAQPVSADWAAEYDAHARELLQAWETADLSALQFSADQQIAELIVHAWDLAKASGQPVYELDPELAAHVLAWSRGVLRPEYRGAGMPFGPEVPVPDDAHIQDRLAGWFGRDPGWPV
jgi:uncharacterized protein (TIGR03086 family)